MNQEVNIDNKKKKLKLYYGLLVTVLCIIGVSFAWFRLYLSQTENNTIASRTCFNTTLTEDTSKISLTDAFPISDEDGLKQTPFTFTLKNNCDSYVKVYITIDSTYRESTDSTYLKDNYMKVNVSPKDIPDNESVILGNQTLTDLESNRKGYIIVNTGLKANEEKSYDLRIWIDSETTLDQGLNKNWAGKVVVVSNAAELPVAPNGWYEAESETLLASLSDSNVLKFPITVPGKEISTESEALLASTEDDYGTSYYFRGNVKNNYVEFANKCWRIVRINGDGTIKLILHNDNTSSVANPCSSANNSTTAAFAHYDASTYEIAFNRGKSDNMFTGFMYGNEDATDYGSTHANINKSEALSFLEIWYTNNLLSYESKLADTIWCNDKSVTAGLGYGRNETHYGAYKRIVTSNSPSLICPNDNNGGKLSKFTVSDTVNGNGNLTYKVGLLTADEIAFAGYAYNLNNSSIFLQENTGENIWYTLSPAEYNGTGSMGYATILDIESNVLQELITGKDVIGGLRPAISLVSSVTISGGTGTSEDPYVIN